MDRKQRIKSKSNFLAVRRKSSALMKKKRNVKVLKATKATLKRHGVKLSREMKRLSTTDGFWTAQDVRISRSSALIDQSDSAKGKKSQTLPSSSKTDQKAKSSSKEKKASYQMKKSIKDTHRESRPKTKSSMELKRLGTTEGFWSPGVTDSTTMSDPDIRKVSVKEKDNSVVRSYSISKSELNRLRSTDGFWSPGFTDRSTRQSSRDASPSSTTSSADRVCRRSRGMRHENSEDDHKSFGSENIVKSLNLEKPLNEGIAHKRTRSYVSNSENDKSTTLVRHKSVVQDLLPPQLDNIEPTPKRIKLDGKKPDRKLQLPPACKDSPESSVSVKALKNIKKDTRTSKTDNSASSKSEVVTPKTSSNTLKGGITISDFVNSGELKRLNTTDGFWSPLPKIAYVINGPRQKRTITNQPSQSHSQLLEHRKKKLKSIKRTALSRPQSLSTLKNTKLASDQKLSLPVSQDLSVPAQEKPKRHRFIFGLRKKKKRKRNRESFPLAGMDSNKESRDLLPSFKNKQRSPSRISKLKNTSIVQMNVETLRGSALVTKSWRRGRIKKLDRLNRSPVKKFISTRGRVNLLNQSLEALIKSEDTASKPKISKTKASADHNADSKEILSTKPRNKGLQNKSVKSVIKSPEPSNSTDDHSNIFDIMEKEAPGTKSRVTRSNLKNEVKDSHSSLSTKNLQETSLVSSEVKLDSKGKRKANVNVAAVQRTKKFNAKSLLSAFKNANDDALSLHRKDSHSGKAKVKSKGIEPSVRVRTRSNKGLKEKEKDILSSLSAEKDNFDTKYSESKTNKKIDSSADAKPKKDLKTETSLKKISKLKKATFDCFTTDNVKFKEIVEKNSVDNFSTEPTRNLSMENMNSHKTSSNDTIDIFDESIKSELGDNINTQKVLVNDNDDSMDTSSNNVMEGSSGNTKHIGKDLKGNEHITVLNDDKKIEIDISCSNINKDVVTDVSPDSLNDNTEISVSDKTSVTKENNSVVGFEISKVSVIKEWLAENSSSIKGTLKSASPGKSISDETVTNLDEQSENKVSEDSLTDISSVKSCYKYNEQELVTCTSIYPVPDAFIEMRAKGDLPVLSADSMGMKSLNGRNVNDSENMPPVSKSEDETVLDEEKDKLKSDAEVPFEESTQANGASYQNSLCMMITGELDKEKSQEFILNKISVEESQDKTGKQSSSCCASSLVDTDTTPKIAEETDICATAKEIEKAAIAEETEACISTEQTKMDVTSEETDNGIAAEKSKKSDIEGKIGKFVAAEETKKGVAAEIKVKIVPADESEEEPVTTEEKEKGVIAIETETDDTPEKAKNADSTEETERVDITEETMKAGITEETEKADNTEKTENDDITEAEKADITEETVKANIPRETGKAVIAEAAEKADITEETKHADIIEEIEKTNITEETENADVIEEIETADTTEKTGKAGIAEETEKAEITEKTEKTVSAEETEKADIMEETEKVDIIDETEKAVIKEETETAFIIEKTVKDFVVEETVKDFTAEETVKDFSAEETVKEFTTEETVKVVTTEETKNTDFKEETEKDFTAEETKNGITLDKTEKGETFLEETVSVSPNIKSTVKLQVHRDYLMRPKRSAQRGSDNLQLQSKPTSPCKLRASRGPAVSSLKTPLRRVRKRRSRLWSRGVLRKAKPLSSNRNRPNKNNTQMTLDPNSESCEGEGTFLKNRQSFKSAKVSSQADTMTDLSMQVSKIIDLSPNKDKPKKFLNLLKRLKTDANLANASVEDKNLQTRARKGLLPISRMGLSKRQRLMTSDITSNVSKPVAVSVIEAMPSTSAPQRESNPSEEEAGNRGDATLPKLTPLDLDPGKFELLSPDDAPPVLTPQKPTDNFMTLAFERGIEEEVVNESVDDTDFHLYLSGASDEEDGSSQSQIPTSILSGTSKANQGKSTRAPVYASLKPEIDSFDSQTATNNEQTDYNPETEVSPVKHRTDSLDSQTATSNELTDDKPVTVVPHVKRRSKMRGKKGRPPGIPVSQSQRDVFRPPGRTAHKSISTLSRPLRTFEFRKKMTRSPLEMLEMKRRQEEAIYDMEMEKIQARKIIRREKRIAARVSAEDCSGEILAHFFGLKPCSVVLSDFVKKLNLEQSVTEIYESSSSPHNIHYEDDLGDEDWCADLEDVQHEEDETPETEESLKRPHIPRLKLKRVPKRDKQIHVKARNLVSEMKYPEQEPLKLVIKTEILSDIEDSVKQKEKRASEPQTIPQASFVSNYLEFLKTRSEGDSVSNQKVASKTPLPEKMQKDKPSMEVRLCGHKVNNECRVITVPYAQKASAAIGPSVVTPPTKMLQLTSLSSPAVGQTFMKYSNALAISTTGTTSKSVNVSENSRVTSDLTGQSISEITTVGAEEEEDMLILDLNDSTSEDATQESRNSVVLSTESKVNAADLSSHDSNIYERPNNDTVVSETVTPSVLSDHLIPNISIAILEPVAPIESKAESGTVSELPVENDTLKKVDNSSTTAITSENNNPRDTVLTQPSNVMTTNVSGKKIVYSILMNSGTEVEAKFDDNSPKHGTAPSHDAKIDSGVKAANPVNIIGKVPQEVRSTVKDKENESLSRQNQTNVHSSSASTTSTDISTAQSIVAIKDSGQAFKKPTEKQIISYEVKDSDKRYNESDSSVSNKDVTTGKIDDSILENHGDDLVPSNNNNNNLVKTCVTPNLTDSSSPVHSTSQEPNEENRKLKTIPSSYKQMSGSYKCKRCNFTAVSKLSIESHIYSHIPGVHFQCVVCQSEFSSMTAISNHFKNSHVNLETEFYISRHVEENNFYTVCEEEEETVTPQFNPPTGGQSPPFIISLVVSGGGVIGTRPVRTSSSTRRFVCTHCGFSTNIKEDVEQHVVDLHSAQILYTCTLCKDSVGLSEARIKEHSLQVHPSRQRPYVKLPDFYDAEQLAMVEKGGSCDERGGSVVRVSTVFPGDESPQEETSVGHQRAKDYLYLQEDWKGKTSAEADSTTVTEYSDENLVEEGSQNGTSEEISKDHDSAAEPNSSSTEAKDVPESLSAVTPTEESNIPQLKIADVVSLSATAQSLADDPVVQSPKATAPGDISIDSVISVSGNSSIQVLSSQKANISHEISPAMPLESSLNQTITSSQPSALTSESCLLASTVHNMLASTCGVESDVVPPRPSLETNTDHLSVHSAISAASFSVLPVTSKVSLSKAPIKEAKVVSLPSTDLETDSASALEADFVVSPQPSATPELVTKISSQSSHDDHHHQSSSAKEGSVSTTTLSSDKSVNPVPFASSQILSSSVTSLSSSSSSSGGLPLSYQCRSCRVHTPYLLMMVRHLKSCHPKILCFSCPYCKSSSSFNTQKQLRNHVRSMHPDKVDKNEMSLSEEAKKFVEAMVLPKSPQCIHVGNRLILEEDIHTCTICSLRMTSLSSVYDHLNEKHSDLFEFVCPSCQIFKNKSLQVVSNHCMTVHQSELDKDKVHVSVPKYLFTNLTCISKQGKYIEKNFISSPSDTSPSKDNSSSNVSGVSIDSTKEPIRPSQGVINTEPQMVQTSQQVPTVDTSFPPPAHRIPPSTISKTPGLPLDVVMKQTPLVAIPIVTPASVAATTRSIVAISSSLFDTSSLSLSRSSSTNPMPTESLPPDIPQRGMISVPQQRLSRPYSLPVLNVPTIRPRSAPISQQPPPQMQPASHDASVCAPSTPLSSRATPTPAEELPDDEPNPDAFKIFNLRPLGSTAAVMSGPKPLPHGTPTVFPPISSTTSLPSGIIPGFPAAMVIPPALIHNAFSFSAPNMVNPMTAAAVAEANKTQGKYPTQSIHPMGHPMHPGQLISHPSQLSSHLKKAHNMKVLAHMYPHQLSSQHGPGNAPTPPLRPSSVTGGQSSSFSQNVLHPQLSTDMIMQKGLRQPSTSVVINPLPGPSSSSSSSPFASSHRDPSPSMSQMSSSTNPFKKGVKSSPLYTCPYCADSVSLRALEVASHIRAAHPGCPVYFQKAS